MRTALDFAPLYRSSIGFDRVFNLLDEAMRLPASDNWPPYDIEKTGEDGYRITLAVAGFAENELHLSAEPNLLLVRGEKAESAGGDYLHHGIALRSFTRRFELADYVTVMGASLANGLLAIDLQRELPAERKPRKIAIGKAEAAPQLTAGDPAKDGKKAA